jgi:predicted transcriptional regulator
MKKRACCLIVALTAGIIFLACIPAVQAEGYTVRPAYGLETGPAQDTSREVSFGELTPRAMVIFVALSFSPILVYPVEFFLFVKLFAYFGYRKADEMALFFNRNRRLVYVAIVENPGIGFNALATLSGVKQAALKYHIHILELKNRIVRHGSPESSGYFENSGRYSDLEKSILIHLRNSTTRRILAEVAAAPDISRRDIAGAVGIAGPSVTWHTNRLVRDGIIEVSRAGRDSRVRLTAGAAGVIRGNLRSFSGVVVPEPSGVLSIGTG